MGIISGKGLFIKGVYKYSVSIKNELKGEDGLLLRISVAKGINKE